jgi:hypothetical protein
MIVLEDCCLKVAFDAEPVLQLEEDDIDPFSGETVGYGGLTYWSNGVVTEGYWEKS